MNPPASLEVEGLVKHFPVAGGLLRRHGVVKAVDGEKGTITFDDGMPESLQTGLLIKNSRVIANGASGQRLSLHASWM